MQEGTWPWGRAEGKATGELPVSKGVGVESAGAYRATGTPRRSVWGRVSRGRKRKDLGRWDSLGTRQGQGRKEAAVTSRCGQEGAQVKVGQRSLRPETSGQSPKARVRVVLGHTHGPPGVPDPGDISKFIGAFVPVWPGSVPWAGTCSHAGRAGQCAASCGHPGLRQVTSDSSWVRVSVCAKCRPSGLDCVTKAGDHRTGDPWGGANGVRGHPLDIPILNPGLQASECDPIWQQGHFRCNQLT